VAGEGAVGRRRARLSPFGHFVGHRHRGTGYMRNTSWFGTLSRAPLIRTGIRAFPTCNARVTGLADGDDDGARAVLRPLRRLMAQVRQRERTWRLCDARGASRPAPFPASAPWVYVHRQSRRLSEIVAALLLGSNNYIANQVFLEISGHRLQGAGICEHGQHGS
jgi:hypothetical protein